MRANPKVLSIGRLYCDLIFTDLPRLPTLGTEVFAGGFSVHAGGGAFITAAHLVALGMPSGLCAFTPAPPFRESVLKEIFHSGVCTALCADTVEGDEPQVTVALAGQSDRAFVTRRTGPAFPDISGSIIKEAGFTHIHIGELTTLIERPDLISLARHAGCTVSLDCGWDDDLDLAAARDLIAAVDVFLPNEMEVALLETSGVGRPFAPLVVVKRGEKGSEAYLDGERLSAPAEPVDAIEMTGAGDAFNAGFLSKWLKSRNILEGLIAGNHQGARAVSMPGGFPSKAVKGDAIPLH